LGLHWYAVSAHPDELILDPPPKKILDPPVAVVPKLWYAYHYWYAKAFKVVREILLIFYTKKNTFCFH